MAKTSQATRNVRKFIKRQTSGVKGKMVTDDYGNKLSVKKKPDGSFGRRHTLSQGKERAHTLLRGKVESKAFHANLKESAKYDKVGNTRTATRHLLSQRRRDMPTMTTSEANKFNYHKKRKFISDSGNKKGADADSTKYAKLIHGTKRKPKDFTK